MKFIIHTSLLLCLSVHPFIHSAATASGLDRKTLKSLILTITHEREGARKLLLNGPERPYDNEITQRFNEIVNLLASEEGTALAIEKLQDAHNSLQNNVPETVDPVHGPEPIRIRTSLARSENPSSSFRTRGSSTQPINRNPGQLPARSSLSNPKNLQTLQTEIQSNPIARLALKQDAAKLQELQDLAKRGNLVARNILRLIN